jgi:ABC-type phosphate transport system substrate-binding protein
MKRLHAIVFATALCLTGLALLPATGATEALSFRVIVHPSNSASTVPAAFLQDAFLKRATRWPSNVSISPVDQRPDSAVRQRFTKDVLRRSVAAIKAYWQQRIFSGRDVPPPELDHDDQVVSYVLNHPGSVGYVSHSTELRGAKVLQIH